MRFRFLLALAVFVAAFAPGSSAADADAAATSNPRKVTVGFRLHAITDIQEPAETFTAICYLHLRWRDPSLVAPGGQRQILIEDAALAKAGEIWRPDIHFVNEANAAEVKHAMLAIAPDGTVDFDRELEVTLTSDLDLHSFPFDRQVLTMEIESAYSAEDLVLEPNPRQMVADALKLAQWTAGPLRWSSALVEDPLDRDKYHRLTVTLEVARRPGFYVWQVFVPLFILILIASTVFFLPAEDLADRISVITTSLLTAVALSYAVHTDLPKISYLTAVDRLFVTVYVFLGLKIVGMLLVRQLVERNAALARKIDRRARWIFPGAYLISNVAFILLSVARG